ncbi:ATP-binding cassette domain-containing protein [Salaquimonas pukyongi]|uniref:ATP-binding cassette domain-containing protein n=1 Tax=Salaquimonas pukyongi TaxID=2712698 RepID=UPI00096B982E|nr:ATP-binding cassette domain-containing protein [Salaquimonas pukyongi]
MTVETKRNAAAASSLCFHAVKIELAGRRLIDLDGCIEPGEVLTVMGPSGCGKSSLLAYVAGFLDPAFTAAGGVTLGGNDITSMPAENRRVGLLFQDALLFPHMSVGGNLSFALPHDPALDSSARRDRIDAALEEAGLAGMADRDPATLSGGQQSRVALMRVLLAQPSALLLDEPFSKLDSDLRQQIRDFVFAEARSRRLPVLLVTHDPADAAAAGGRVIELTG